MVMYPYNDVGLTTVQIQELSLLKQVASDLFSPNDKLVQKVTTRGN